MKAAGRLPVFFSKRQLLHFVADDVACQLFAGSQEDPCKWRVSSAYSLSCMGSFCGSRCGCPFIKSRTKGASFEKTLTGTFGNGGGLIRLIESFQLRLRCTSVFKSFECFEIFPIETVVYISFYCERVARLD